MMRLLGPILATGRSTLVSAVALADGFFAGPGRGPVAVMILQRAVDQRGEQDQRSEEIHRFHVRLPYRGRRIKLAEHHDRQHGTAICYPLCSSRLTGRGDDGSSG